MGVEHIAQGGPAVKTGVDVTVGVGAIASPEWLPLVHSVSEVAGAIAALGGLVLLYFRLKLVILDIRKRHGKPPSS